MRSSYCEIHDTISTTGEHHLEVRTAAKDEAAAGHGQQRRMLPSGGADRAASWPASNMSL